jgi:assimilatory nitrate reductase catalytic subunit
VTKQNPAGTERMFSNGRFYTESGKARFVSPARCEPANSVDENYPLALNSGRIRDQWHTMTRTGKAARLSQHIDEPFVEIHPDDAQRYGIRDRHLVEVNSKWGRAVARAQLSDKQLPGSVFMPMHWSDRYSAQACVGRLVNPVTDPVSGQPEFKHTPVRIKPFKAAWYGFILSRNKLERTGLDYWTVIQDKGMWRYELAAKDALRDWSVRLKAGLCRAGLGEEWIEFSDQAQRRYRAACIVNGKLQACIFTDATPDIMERAWLRQLFDDQPLQQRQRMALLAGSLPGSVPDEGPIICSCFSVGLKRIQQAIVEQKLLTVEAIGEALRAGSNCGSCKPEINRIILEMIRQTAA